MKGLEAYLFFQLLGRYTNIRAIISETGSKIEKDRQITAHWVIVAGGMGISVIINPHQEHGGRVKRFFDVINDNQVVYVTGGTTGRVIVNPTPWTRDLYKGRQAQAEAARIIYESRKNDQSVTLDGKEIVVKANLNDSTDVEQVARSGGSGVGLFRTEFIYIVESHLKDIQKLFTALVKTFKDVVTV